MSYDDEDEDYGYDPDDDQCDHIDRDIDILTGRWSCYRCGEHGWASDREIQAEIKHQAEYAEWIEREERRIWWRDLFAPITRPLRRLRWRMLHRPSNVDDEIPF